MKDNIFAELYNKLLGFFRQAEEEESAKDVACNRLRVVLMQDRTNLTPQLLEKMRGELVELLSKYLEMDKDALELNLDQEGEQMALMLSIPVIRAKDEAEIEKALAEEEAKDEAEIEKALAEEEAKKLAETNAEEDEAAEEAESEAEAEEEDLNAEEDAAEAEADVDSEDETPTEVKKFPNKEICGDYRECEFSDDIECEKKIQPKKVNKNLNEL